MKQVSCPSFLLMNEWMNEWMNECSLPSWQHILNSRAPNEKIKPEAFERHFQAPCNVSRRSREMFEFDLFGYLSWKWKCPKILGNEIFISEIDSRTLPSREPFAHSKLLGKNCKNIPSENVKNYFSLVAESFRWCFSKEIYSCLQHKTEILRTVWLSRKHISPNIIVGCPCKFQMVSSNIEH